MSSEESMTTNSSQLRQFGLYRNIDTRTEEFLKLSRKRQMRQGCACAAVSTAITVTVVVSVLIVFEYGFHADPDPTLQPKHKPNWISMINDSETHFDISQSTANIKSTVIIPLLLKALKHNRILEKVLEEYSSNTPAYDGDSTDYPLQRNIFTDARNWMRMPSSRMYAIEYKNSPIVFFKTRNIHEFYKARKMMDSQRMTNYLDRMMNDKAPHVPNIPTNSAESNNSAKKISSTLSPKRAIIHYTRLEEPKKNKNVIKSSPTNKTLNANDCKCPSNMGHILHKLVLNIQELFKKNRIDKTDPLKVCAGTHTITRTNKPKEQTALVVTNRRTVTTERPPKVTTYYSSSLPALFDTKPPLTNISPGWNLSKILTKALKNKTEQSDSTSFIINTKQDYQNYSYEKFINETIIETTTLQAYLEFHSNELYKSVTTTKPMIPVTKQKSKHRVTTVQHYLKMLQSKTVYAPEYTNYDMIEVTTSSDAKSVTKYDEDWWTEENEVNKKKTLANFLLKEIQKNNKKFEDSRLDNFDDHRLDYPTVRTLNLTNVLTHGKGHDVVVKKNKVLSKALGMRNDNVTLIAKAKYKIKAVAATKDEFGSVIRDLTEWKTVPVNITYGSIRVSNDSNENPISVVPQLRPPFLEIRRNEGKVEEEDEYDVNHGVIRDFFN